MFERFTEDAREVVVCAQKAALALEQNRIESGHLLLGVLRVGGPATELVSARFGMRLDALRVLVGDMAPAVARDPGGQVPFVPEAKRALEAALRSALELGHAAVRPLDILRGLLDSSGMVSARALKRAGVDTDALREAVQEQLRAIPADKEAPVAMALRPSPRLYAPPRDPLAGIAPAVVSLELTLGRSASVAVLLPELRAYPGGTLWSLMFLGCENDDTVNLIYALAGSPPPGDPDRSRPPCEISVRYPDGRVARLVGNRGAGPTDTELGVWSRGSGGTGVNFGVSYYVAPPPSPGSIIVNCEWPAFDIPNTQTEIDARPVVDAAKRATQLWPDN